MLIRIFLSLLLVGILFSPAAAQQSSAPAGITVTPVIDEFDAQPGSVVIRTVRVINPVSQVVTLYPRMLNFHTDNESGQPIFFTEKERSTTFGLANWATFSKPLLRIAPNEEEKFDVTLRVPLDAEPGGHYGAILFSTEEPRLDEDLTQIGVIGLVGTLLLARVPGAITEKMILEDFTAPSIIIDPPAKFSLLFNNMGNVHLKPKGEIKIRNWSGKAVTSLVVNEGRGNVLPESKRRFENQWQFDWKSIGRYTATAVIAYGAPEQQLIASRVFYVVPLWLIIAVGVLLILIFAWIFRRRRKGKVVAVNKIPPSSPAPPRLVMR